MRNSFFLTCALATALVSAAAGQTPRLILPTANDALLRGEGEAFYQYVERNVQGVISYPWEGGQYGFTRDPHETGGGTVFTHFHEGIDIKPLRRDAQGEPLDEVVSIAAGRVVHVNDDMRHSNYGRYIVVEHRWNGSPYYSLYAHLAAAFVRAGESVVQGARLGRMGHTGAGINRERSHVHFEINLLLSQKFQDWYLAGAPTEPNYHGLYNGLNLAGFDVAKFYLAQRRNPALSVPEFLGGEEAFFRVLAPAGPEVPDLLKRYPWMGESGGARPASWEISFTRAGVPLRVEKSSRTVTTPTLSWAKSVSAPYWMLTRRLIYGAGSNAALSPYGRRLVDLIMALPAPAGQPSPLMPGDRKQSR